MSTLKEKCLATRANTQALLACLRACEDGMLLSEAEAELAGTSPFRLSVQSPYALMTLLVSWGGLEKIAESAAAAPESMLESAPKSETDATAVLEGDCLLKITPAGREVLAALDPVKRFEELVSIEPAAYEPVYRRVMQACVTPQSLACINEVVGDLPALFEPKRVYPEYFISKLEAIGVLKWEDAWKTTEAGEAALG